MRWWLGLMWGALQADMLDHLKPAQGKGASGGIPGIDYVYMINLDQRPEKFARASSQLLRYGVVPYRFAAVNGWELPLEVVEDVGVKFELWMRQGTMGTYYGADGVPVHEPVHMPGRSYFCHCMSRGAVGIALSHVSVLQDAWDSGYETIWVLEDDVEVVRDPHCLSAYIEKLDALVGDWDILFTDRDTRNNLGQYVPCTAFAWRPNFVPSDERRSEVREARGEFLRIGARFGAYSMIVRRSGMQKLLQFFANYQLFLPYDIEMYYPNGMQLFCVAEDVVVPQLHALSDNGAPMYAR